MKRTIRPVRWTLWLGLLAGFLSPAAVRAQPDGGVHEYLTREEALRDVFPQSRRYVREAVRLSPAETERVERDLRRDLGDASYETTLCYDAAGAFLGYVVITEELGKYRPITIAVGVRPNFSVEKVAVMVYREDRGGEVRRPRFLYQYRGKTADDPVRTNRDIVNVSGATISVRALNDGVRRVLYLVTAHYRGRPPAARISEGGTQP